MTSAPQWPAVGIHPGIAPETYFAPHKGAITERIVSKSMLWDFDRNPKRWLMSPEKEITEAMRWGSLVDCLALTPERFSEAYRIQPATYMSAESAKKDAPMIEKPWNWNANTCKAWREALPAGIEVIDTWKLKEAEAAAKTLCARREFAEMMEGARTQVGTRFDFGSGIHGIDGLKIAGKGLIDIVPDRQGAWGGYLVDLKTTGKIDDMEQIERTIWNYGYHAQAALYIDMWNALTGEDRDRFILVFQLSAAPHEVAVVELSDEMIIAGREWYVQAIARWARIVTTGEWESPWDGVRVAGIPAWAAKRGRDAV